MIRFVPGIDRGDFTDPSYHVPAFYELWARWGPPAERSFWAQAASASRAFFPKTANPNTGLAPAYANFDGTPHATGFPQSTIFGYDSWRTASNWSVDWSWWQKAPQEQQLSDRIQAFFTSQGLATYGDLYTLDGKPISLHHSTGLVATNAVASLAATNPRARDFVKALWDSPVPSGQQRYYDGMLYLLSLLHCGGQFRIWNPREPAGRLERDHPLGDRLTLPLAESYRPEPSGSPEHHRGGAPGQSLRPRRRAVETIEPAVRCSGCPQNTHVVRLERHPHKSRPSDPPVTLPT
jgi:oligosaccharide reducing-end xylanase